MSVPTRPTHHCAALDLEQAGNRVVLMGWVERIRDLGGLLFLDLLDYRGVTQIVVRPESGPAAEAKRLGAWWVIAVEGVVLAREAETVNPGIQTGKIEVEARAHPRAQRGPDSAVRADRFRGGRGGTPSPLPLSGPQEPEAATQPADPRPAGHRGPRPPRRTRVPRSRDSVSDPVHPGRGPGLPGAVPGPSQAASTRSRSRRSSSSNC